MEILIESTKTFEKDLGQLSDDVRKLTIEKINACAALFPSQKTDGYRKLVEIRPVSGLNGYDSSLHTLEASRKLRVILSIDEDPIFDQVIFTLFRVVKHDELDGAFQGIAEVLYQDLLHHHQEVAPIA